MLDDAATRAHARGVQTTRQTQLAIAIVLAATVGFAFKGILARFAYGEGVSVTALLLARAALATPMLWLLSIPFLRSFAGISRADYVKAFASGFLFLCSSTLDFMAVQRLGAGPSRLILFVYPLFVLLMEALRRRRAPSWQEILAFVVAWCGLLIVSAESFGPNGELSGVLFGLGAATSHATFLVLSQKVVGRMGSIPFSVVCNTGTAVGIIGYVGLFVSRDTIRYTNEGVFWLALLALFCTALPAILLVEGVRRMGAGPSSLLSLVSPVVTLAAAYWMLREALTVPKLTGAALVIGAVGWHTASQMVRPAPPTPQRVSPA